MPYGQLGEKAYRQPANSSEVRLALRSTLSIYLTLASGDIHCRRDPVAPWRLIITANLRLENDVQCSKDGPVTPHSTAAAWMHRLTLHNSAGSQELHGQLPCMHTTLPRGYLCTCSLPCYPSPSSFPSTQRHKIHGYALGLLQVPRQR